MKPWEEFEALIAKIQSETAPDATVHHNHKVIGMSGRERQLDITISKKVGLYPVFIVIECKHSDRRPVGIEKVEAFITKLRDVGASQGVMISNAGFDAGAKAIAKQNFVTLFSYREAQEIDWQSIVSSDAWLKMIFSRSENVTVTVIFTGQFEGTITLGLILFDEAGNHFCTLEEVVRKVTRAACSMKPVGPFTTEASIDPPLYLNVMEELRQVQKISVQGVNVAKEYIINVRLASGHVLENALTEERVFRQVVTEGFDWTELIKSQAGREVSEKEYEEMIKNSNNEPIPLNPDEIGSFLRVVITS